MHRIVAQQVSVALDGAEIVDGDDFDVGALGLVDRPQDVAADAAKPVDLNPDCHSTSPLKVQGLHLIGITCPE
jgi:hypothetical protein